jgi:hypothetical protein
LSSTEFFATAVRLALGAILVVAVLGKLHPAGFSRAVLAAATLFPACRDRCGRLAATALLVVEASIGTALVLGVPSHAVGLMAAAVLFALLAGLLGYGLTSRGLTDCACFGVLSRKKAGRSTLVRTSAMCLTACAALGVELRSMADVPLLTAMCLGVLGALALATVPATTTIAGATERLPSDLIGSRVSIPSGLSDELPATGAFLLFLSPDCASCRDAPAALAETRAFDQTDIFVGLDPTAASASALNELQQRLRALPHRAIAVEDTRTLMKTLNLRWFPLLVRIGPNDEVLEAYEGVGDFQRTYGLA